MKSAAKGRNKRPTALADLSDSERIDCLAASGGFIRGSDGGQVAFRIFGHDAWHPTLREAIDEAAALARLVHQRRLRENTTDDDE